MHTYVDINTYTHSTFSTQEVVFSGRMCFIIYVMNYIKTELSLVYGFLKFTAQTTFL